MRTVSLLTLLSGVSAIRSKYPIQELRKEAAQAWELEHGPLSARATDPSLLYPAHNLSVPVDHFHNESMYEPHSDEFFNLRYWFDASNYKPGGPVIVLGAGETSGRGRLPFLQKGMIAQLAQATHGIAVVLEHRYYGTSFPTADLSTKSLRFLTVDQAMADTTYFAHHVKFEGLEHVDLSPNNTAWIAYGGSYAGAFVAFLRKLYPETWWGAISSSGVTAAVYDFWQYFEAHRLYGPPECVATTQNLTHVMDNILIGKKDDAQLVQQVKDVFGVGNLTHSDDLAYWLADGIGGWQGKNWDPAVSTTDFDVYCDTVTSDKLRFPEKEEQRAIVENLIREGGYADQADVLTTRMLNYGGWFQDTHQCKAPLTQDQCFTQHNTTFWQLDDIAQTWRCWPYQVCTQWGYLQVGSTVPPTQLPLVSRLLDIPYMSIFCRESFNIHTPSDVEAINKHGGFNFSYPRVAIIDGEADPWRQATPHAIGLPDRVSTTSEPFILIGGLAVHHWDENGLFPNETTPELPPQPVKDAQAAEIQFVKEWMAEWKGEHCASRRARAQKRL